MVIKMKRNPWYTNEKFVYIISIIAPIIAYIIILLNKKKWQHVKYIEYLSFATITTSIWIIGLIPGYFRLAFILTILIFYFIRKIFKSRE